MKKRFTRVLAMLLCVLTVAALLPAAALAADDVDEVKGPVSAVVNSKSATANGKTAKTYTIKAKAGERWKMQDPYRKLWKEYGVSVKYQWYVKKKGSSKWTKIKGATKYYYDIKATKS